MEFHELNHSIKNGTIAGTIFTIVGTITTGDIFKTILLAAIGALVSFVISGVLRWVSKKLR